MMLRALLTIGAVQAVTMLVMLARTKTLALLLGPELVGVMAVVDKLLAVIAQTASLSLPYAAVRFLPTRWEAGPAEYRGLFARMRNVLLLVVLAATAAALAVAVFYPQAWGAALLPYREVVILATLGLPVVALVPYLQNAVAGRMEQYRSMLVSFLHALVLALAVGGVLWAGLAGYYAAYAVLGLVLVAGATRIATRGTAPPAAQPALPLALPGEIWSFSGALLVLTFLAPYAALYVHYRLLSNQGAEAAGWMQAAIGISLSVRAVLGSAHSVFLTPNVNRGGTPEENMRWTDNFETTLALIAGLAVPPLLLFPDLFVHLLYSAAFLPGAAFVALFVLAETIGLLSGTYQALVVAFGHMRYHVAHNLVAQLLVVGAAYLLVEPYGILGAGLASLAAPVAMLVLTLLFLHRKYRLRMPRHLAARVAWLVAGLVAAGIAGATFREFTLPVVAGKAALFALIAAGFGLLLTPHERERLRAALSGWRARWL